MWPSISIWIKPEATFEKLSQLPADMIKKKINLIFIVVALSQAFTYLFIWENNLPLYVVIGLSLLLVSVGYVILYYVFPRILFWVSRIFNGKADIKQLRLVVAYSVIPYLLNGLMVLVSVIDSYLIKDVEIFQLNLGITYWIATFLSISFIS